MKNYVIGEENEKVLEKAARWLNLQPGYLLALMVKSELEILQDNMREAHRCPEVKIETMKTLGIPLATMKIIAR